MNHSIDIFGEIGDLENDKITIRRKLDEANGADVILNISSLGGSVDDALSIYDDLKAYTGKTTAKLTGFVASAATIIAMGADEVLMSENALFLVHKSMSSMFLGGMYNEDDIEQMIKDLNKMKEDHQKVDLIIANIYSKNTGRKAKTMLDLMKEDKWLSYDEAKDYGFVNGKLKGQKMSNDTILKMVASAEFSKLPQLPEQFQNTINMNEVKGLIGELKEFIASKLAPAPEAAEAKFADLPEVQEKLQTIEATIALHDSEIESKNAEIAALTDEISKLKAVPSSVEANDPDPSDEPKKSEWQSTAEGVLASLPKIAFK